MKKTTSLFLIGVLLCTAVTAQYNPMSKEASSYTIKINDSVRYMANLNFYSTADSMNAHRGALKVWPDLAVTKDTGDAVVWNMEKFNFLNSAPSQDAPHSVNPSLWREAKLNYVPGIFEVKAGSIYQARGFDLSNITFIKGNSGWIVIDPLVTRETAKAALDSLISVLKALKPSMPVYNKVSAVIFTHSHIDHYGGILGIMDRFTKSTKIFAPSDFLEHAVSENTIAGNVMGRRAAYMYGSLYPRGEKRMVDAGLGKGISSGTSGIVAKYISISAGILKPASMPIDGITVEFWSTPGAEAPVEMMFYFPSLKALCASEEVTHTMHNVYSLRGTRVRDALGWSKFIDSTLTVYGQKADVVFASHHWPVWGSSNISKLLTTQRNLYRYIHDQTMRMANQGMTALEIANSIQLPESLDTVWANRGYYGTLSHNSKSVYDYYLGGWFDGNPANLNPLPPTEAGKKYVEFMGGPDSTLAKARRSYDNGEYRWAATVLNHLVFADSSNNSARLLLADTYEQLGYQSESGPWRNFYLTGAQELRFKSLPYTKQNKYPTNEVMNAMPLSQYLDFLAIHLVPQRAGALSFNFDVAFNDPGKTDAGKIFITLQDNTINYKILPVSVPIPSGVKIDAAVRLPRNVMNTIINYGGEEGVKAMKQAVSSGKAIISGNANQWYAFIGMLEQFEFWFNIVTP